MLVLAIIVSVLSCIAGALTMIAFFDKDYRKYGIFCLLLPIGIIGIFLIRHYDENYSLKYHNPNVRYGTVRAITDNKMVINDTGMETKNLQRSRADISHVKEGDIVRVIHVNGIFRAYIIKVQKLVIQE